MNTTPESPDVQLEQLLNRNDIWRGQLRSPATQITMDTGYPQVNAALLNAGWPTRNLIEVCQKGLQQQEWLLFGPLVKASGGYSVLLNPPAMPFCQAMIQAGWDLDRIIVVNVTNKADFIASFVELARSESCELLLAWQQNHNLTYTELRKCLLATNDGAGVCVLFRPESAQQQSSPAALRLVSSITANDIQLRIFKQKGMLQEHSKEVIRLDLPKAWKGFLPYHLLDQTLLPGKSDASSEKRKPTNVLPLRRGKR